MVIYNTCRQQNEAYNISTTKHILIQFFLFSLLYLSSCRHCGQYYWDLKLMRKHTKANKRPTHKGQFLCDTCGKEFKSYHPLIAHVRLLHSVDERPTFECYMCRRTFSSKYRLKDHMSVHMTTETATYTCGICHKVLPRKNSLRRHSLIHTNVYAHECTACGKAFRRKKELTVRFRSIAFLSRIFVFKLMDVNNISWTNVNYSFSGSFTYSYGRETVWMHIL